MNPSKLHLFIIAILLMVLPLLGGCSAGVSEQSPRAVEGVLDLTEWQPDTGVVKLDGQWSFYWDQLLDPQELSDHKPTSAYIDLPGSWNGYRINGSKLPGDGYATYRLIIKTDTNDRWGLKIPRIFTAYNLRVNNELIAAAGTIGTNRSDVTPQYLPQVALFEVQPGENEIVIQVANFYHRSGGVLESLILGSEEQILGLRYKSIAYELFLFGSLLIIGLYHLALFIFRKKDYAALYFCLYCLLIAIRTLLVGERFFIFLYPGFSWEMAHKMQTMTFYLGVPILVMFFKSIFPSHFSTRLLRIVQVVGFSFAAVVLLTPARIFSVINPIYQLFVIVVIVYLLYFLTNVLRRKEPGTTLIVVGAFVLFAASLNDIVFLSVWMGDHGSPLLRSIFRSGNLSSLGLLVFVFTQSMVLAQNYAHVFDKQEEMTRQLTEINANLDEVVKKRTTALEMSKKEIEQQKAELEKVNQVLHVLTLKDPLTGLWNRRHFDKILEMEWNRCLRNQKPLALLVVDVDHFKGYNDSYGHQAGDECLIKIARTIDGLFRRASDLAVRYGGDEFVVVLPETGKDEAEKMAITLRQAVEDLAITGDNFSSAKFYATISIGGASIIPDLNFPPTYLFQRADQALYQAKEAGRNQIKILSE